MQMHEADLQLESVLDREMIDSEDFIEQLKDNLDDIKEWIAARERMLN